MGRVIAGPASTVHLLGRVTETVQRVELLASRAGLVADTALVTEVVLVAGGGVLHLHIVLGAADSAVREGVVTSPGIENISLLSAETENICPLYLAAEERPVRQRRVVRALK